MIAVLQLTLYAGAATAAHTPSATLVTSKRASPPPGPSCAQQSMSTFPFSLLLESGQRDAPYEGSLEEQEDDGGRDHGDDRDGHNLVIGGRVDALHLGQPERKGRERVA